MKKIIALIAFVISTVAAAESTLIFETKNYANYDVTTEFQVNEKLGRAWVNVELAEYWGDSTTYDDNRVKIEGLSFDVATKTIVLEKDGEQIVCGSMYNRRWVIDGGRSIRNSGKCTFSVKKIKKQFDNGFEVYYVPMIQVFLNVE